MFNTESYKILAYNQAIDFRKSFNSLLEIIKHVLKQDPFSETLYLFYNRRRNSLKIFYWDRTGYCILSKKLESGGVALPGFSDIQELTREQIKLIFDGIKLAKN
jgi:transposase